MFCVSFANATSETGIRLKRRKKGVDKFMVLLWTMLSYSCRFYGKMCNYLCAFMNDTTANAGKSSGKIKPRGRTLKFSHTPAFNF